MPSSLNGQDATIAAPGSRHGEQPVPAFNRPALVLDAANSLNAATPTSTMFYGSNITLTMPATLDIKGVTKSFVGPANSPAQLPALPVGLLGVIPHFIELNHHYDDLEPVKGAPYKLLFADDSTISGKLDDNGFARHEGVQPGSAKVVWGEDERSWQAEAKRPNDHLGSASDAQAAIEPIQKLLK